MSTLRLPKESSVYTLIHARAVLEDRILENASFVVKDGVIAAVGTGSAVKAEGEVFDLSGKLLTPGLIDTHIHGAVGRDFMEGTPEAIEEICRMHARGGTTALLATTVTEDIPRVAEVLRVFREVQGKQAPDVARVMGAHIEGPFISPERPGVHDLSKMRHPTRQALDELLASGCPIRLFSFAPELPGSIDFLHALAEHGIHGSAAHSDAWDEEARAAHDAGLRRTTHTFNCMSTARKRGALRVAGMLEFALGEPSMTCELISDGIHVSSTLMKMLYRAKGTDGICLITDASAGCGVPEGQEFMIAGRRCHVSGGMAVAVESSNLAGGILTMITAVRNMVEMVGVPLVDAVKMATVNPAKVLGLGDTIGVLKPGARADFLVVEPDLQLVATYIGGRQACQLL